MLINAKYRSLQNEDALFGRKKAFRGVLERCGIKRLQANLNQELSKTIFGELPPLKNKLEKTLFEIDERLGSMQIAENDEDFDNVIADIKLKSLSNKN